MRSQKYSSPTAKKQAGVGIVEVLVALVVVSLGVLGMASLQLTGMQQSSGGYNRSKALLYAENMATRMRTNRVAIDTMLFSNFDSNDATCTVRPDPYCQAREGLDAQSCSPVQLANFDMFTVACGDWGKNSSGDGVIGSLPNGRLNVVCDEDPCLTTSTYTITVSWIEGQRVSTDLDDTITRRVQMRMRP